MCKAQTWEGSRPTWNNIWAPQISLALNNSNPNLCDQQKIKECHHNSRQVLKPNKPSKDLNSYQRITVNSIIRKLVEKEMLHQTEAIKWHTESKLQFVFTEKSSASNCALIVTETQAEDHTVYFILRWEKSVWFSLAELCPSITTWSMNYRFSMVCTAK